MTVKKTETRLKVVAGIEEGKARIYTWTQLMGGPDKTEWMLEGLFPVCSVITVTGEPGAKKTWSFLDYAVSNANYENEWLGFKINHHVPVLLIDEESGNERLGIRLKEIVKGHNVKNKLDITAACISGFNFRSTDDLMELEVLVKQSGARLIIIDTLMDVLAGGDDNASKDVNPLYKGLRKIADKFRALVIVIHHTNRNGNYRGSSAIKGSSDLMIKISSKQDSPNVDFEVEKKRDGMLASKWAAYIYSSEGSFTLRKSGKIPSKVGKVQEHIISYLHDYNRATINDLQKNSGDYSKSSVKGAVYPLVKDGLLFEDGYDGKQKCYILTPEGQRYAETFLPKDMSFLQDGINKK